MTKYYLNKHNVYLPTKNGQQIVLSITENSGKILYRDKIDTVIGIKHPGIELGVDQYGYRWILHHHKKNKYPAIEREDIFSIGENIFYDNRQVWYGKYQIIERALFSWWNGNEYHWLLQNCQHFVNEIIRDEHSSDAVDSISNGAMTGGGWLALLGIFTENKALTYTGLGLIGGGAFGKAINR